MLIPGLASVTFRHLTPDQIIELAAETGLRTIEWGGDVHVPPAKVKIAREVRKQTEDRGIGVSSYGSYYCVGPGAKGPVAFEAVVETALALGASTIRVWAGNRASAQADDAWWNLVVEDARRVADLARDAGLTVSFEYHPNTLTDTADSAYHLLGIVHHDKVQTYWQPYPSLTVVENLASLRRITSWLSNVHVFYWKGKERRPLKEARHHWRRYLEQVRGRGRDHNILLEFVAGDDPEQLRRDAAALHRLIR